MLKSEIRKAYLLNKYVIITPSRSKRPRDIKEQTIIKRTADCPFCPKNINEKNIVDKIEKNKKWQILSIKNIFPAVSLDNEKAYGMQEVIIETREHLKELAELKASNFEDVYEFADLIEVLYTVARLKGFEQKDITKAIYMKNTDKGAFYDNIILMDNSNLDYKI